MFARTSCFSAAGVSEVNDATETSMLRNLATSGSIQHEITLMKASLTILHQGFLGQDSQLEKVAIRINHTKQRGYDERNPVLRPRVNLLAHNRADVKQTFSATAGT